MPITRRPTRRETIIVSDAIIPAEDDGPDPGGVGFSAGVAIALVDVAGTQTLLRCSAMLDDGYPGNFFGFLYEAVALGAQARTVSGRGSRVVPQVEGGGNLTVNEDVFLSKTPGMVTQSLVMESGIRVIRVGSAVSTTEMVLSGDAYFEVPA
jgi:hypothetical protein